MPTRAASARACVAVSLLLLGPVGCGSQASSGAPTKATVSIKGYAFLPSSTRVAVGARVTWANHDATPHTATAQDRSFDTDSIAPGQTRTITLSKPGTYTYYCAFHAFMRAQITVVK